MARYYEENALIEFVKERTPTINGETTMECVERAIREAPSADVVPNSEVEEWKAEAIHYQGLWCQSEIELDQTKQEVAREIFEEIDELLVQNATMQIATSTFHCKLAELKKKYTESEGKQ